MADFCIFGGIGQFLAHWVLFLYFIKMGWLLFSCLKNENGRRCCEVQMLLLKTSHNPSSNVKKIYKRKKEKSPQGNRGICEEMANHPFILALLILFCMVNKEMFNM